MYNVSFGFVLFCVSDAISLCRHLIIQFLKLVWSFVFHFNHFFTSDNIFVAQDRFDYFVDDSASEQLFLQWGPVSEHFHSIFISFPLLSDPFYSSLLTVSVLVSYSLFPEGTILESYNLKSWSIQWKDTLIVHNVFKKVFICINIIFNYVANHFLTSQE